MIPMRQSNFAVSIMASILVGLIPRKISFFPVYNKPSTGAVLGCVLQCKKDVVHTGKLKHPLYDFRKPRFKGCPLLVAPYPDFTALDLHNALRNGQSQAGTPCLLRT